MDAMRAIVLLLTLLLSAPASATGPLAFTGAAHTGQFRYEGRVIPLPPGTWRELTRHASFGTAGNTTVKFLALVREMSTGTDAVVFISAFDRVPTSYYGGSWVVPESCTRNDTYLLQANDVGTLVQDCLLVLHGVPRPLSNGGEAWDEWVRLSREHPGAMPATLVGARYRFARAERATTVTYFFGVEAAGFPRQDTSLDESTWHPTRLDDARRAYVQRVTNWATANADAVRAGVMRQREATLPNP